MTMHPVESSNLAEVGWSKGTLTVLFKNGSTYQFEGVGRGVYLALLKSPSKGHYFHRNVKGKYEYRRVRTEEDS